MVSVPTIPSILIPSISIRIQMNTRMRGPQSSR